MDKTVLLTLLVQLVLPVVVGLVTKRSLPKDLKFVLLAALTALNTGVVGYLGGSDLKTLLGTGALGLLAAVGSHYGVYKPLGVTDKVQDVLVKDAPLEEPVEAPVVDAEAPAEEAPAEDVNDDAVNAEGA